MLCRLLIFLLLPAHDAVKVAPGSPTVLLQKGEKSDEGRIKLFVLVEAFCPGCINWIVKGLQPMMEDKEFKKAMDVELVWYGNAHQDQNDMPMCQHGPNECVGNAIMECSKKKLSEKASWNLTFCTTDKLHTMMFTDGKALQKHKGDAKKGGAKKGDAKKGDAKKESNLLELNKTFLPAPAKNGLSHQCAMKIPEAKAKWDEIVSCVQSDEGLNLLRRGAQITMSTNHQHTPWVSTYSRGMLDLDWKILGAGYQHQPFAESNPPGFICENSPASIRPSRCSDLTGGGEKGPAKKPCGKDSPCFFSQGHESDVCLKDGLKTEVSISP